jgi:large subunit ribosomal protein L22
MANATRLAARGIPTTGKTNERPGTRCVVRHVRMSAYKARVVLDLIRDKDVQTADEILKFSERDAAIVIRKALRSAVANAEHNDDQIADDLYVSACFADEGKTLRRFRPRARGRASRIRKRTCHITVIVSRLPDDKLERKRAKDASRPGSRAARVAGQQLEQEGRRRRRRRSRGEGGAAEEAGIVDQQEAAIEQAEDAIEAGEVENVEPTEDAVADEPTAVEIAAAEEEQGIVDPDAQVAAAAEEAEGEEK